MILAPAIRFGTGGVLLAVSLVASRAASQEKVEPASTSCLTCHANPDVFEAEARNKVDAMKTDVHAGVGLSCHDCHGGNPDPSLAEDAEAAMDPGYAPNPYRGAPGAVDIPGFCGRCHSDPLFMRRFRPDPRIDQETEYRGSFHGRALAAGDTRVATCIDCHGVHGILRVTDAGAPVHPTHVAETCKRCHADPQRMAGSRLPDGRPLPVNQYDQWRRSVHAAALLEKGDLSSPTCNDCHGNHGAAPPGLESVAYVCGQCHGREAELFRASPKHEGFETHNGLLADSETATCAECHDAPDPQAALTSVRSFTECATCHGNHAILRPTMAILGGLPETPCAFCHEGPDSASAAVVEPERIRRHYREVRDGLLAEAAALNLDDDARFDWFVDRALSLPTHTVAAATDSGDATELRPAFARLFQKFRIGKTSYTYFDPAVGREVEARVVQCGTCHGPEASSPVGYTAARDFLGRMEELTALTARAERTLLAAQRGGVELRGGLLDLDKAVDSQIELEVLVHSFSDQKDGAFAKKHAEGVAHAGAALTAGQAGLHELKQRRTGLAVSLVFIAFTLLALALTIRRVSRSEG